MRARRAVVLGVLLVAVASLAGAGAGALEADAVQVVQTSQGNGDRWAHKAALNWTAPQPHVNTTFVVNASTTYQRFQGFGGAFTDSSAHNFFKLSDENQQQVIRDYFDADKGLGYVMARLPMGSCDFSYTIYNYANVSGDTNLTHFSIDHDEKQLIPLIKRAQAVAQAPLKIVASPWSPPGWMKENGWQVCGIATCLLCRLKKEYHDTWALYFSKFVDAYTAQGIPIWGVTVQNEPGACPVTYEGMHWDPRTQRDFIKGSLGPVFKTKHPDVKIFAYDHNKKDVLQWVDTIMGDDEAAKYMEGTAVHWYDGDHFDQLAAAHRAYPHKTLLASEATVARDLHPDNPLWKNGEHYAHDIIGDLNNFVVGWIDWNLLLDRLGGPDHAGPEECEGIIKCGSSAMLMADLDEQVVYKQVFYWYMGHFSRHIKPGSVRVDLSTTSDTALEATAWLTPQNTTVFVVMNREGTATDFQVVSPQKGGKAVHTRIPAHSIQTLTWH